MKTNKKISDEDLAWLQAHKQSVEHRDRTLKGIGVYAIYLIIVSAFASALTAYIATALIAINATATLFAVTVFLIGLIMAFVSLITPDKYIKEGVIGIISGFIIGLIIALVYIAPMVSMSQYPISMQVFYPNHPNITITQNCTDFTTSESGYLNGQPINPKNTTQCNLPWNMAPDDSNPFNCNISNKSITCSGTGYSSVIWSGTILNVSKR